MEKLGYDELYIIAKSMDNEDLRSMKNTCKRMREIIHESTILSDKAYWQNYLKSRNDKRRSLFIPILNYYIEWTYNKLCRRQKIHLVQDLTTAEVDYMNKILEIQDNVTVTRNWPRISQYQNFNNALEAILIDLHLEFRKLCRQINHNHSMIHPGNSTTEGKNDMGDDICILENTIYNYIKEIPHLQQLAIYTLIIFKKGKLLHHFTSIINKKKPTEQQQCERETLLEDLMYLMPRDLLEGAEIHQDPAEPITKLATFQKSMLQILEE